MSLTQSGDSGQFITRRHWIVRIRLVSRTCARDGLASACDDSSRWPGRAPTRRAAPSRAPLWAAALPEVRARGAARVAPSARGLPRARARPGRGCRVRPRWISNRAATLDCGNRGLVSRTCARGMVWLPRCDESSRGFRGSQGTPTCCRGHTCDSRGGPVHALSLCTQRREGAARRTLKRMTTMRSWQGDGERGGGGPDGGGDRRARDRGGGARPMRRSAGASPTPHERALDAARDLRDDVQRLITALEREGIGAATSGNGFAARARVRSRGPSSA